MADIPIRQEIANELGKIYFRELLDIAGFVLSEDSNENQRSPCFRRGGNKDRSEAKLLLMNKGQDSEMLYDPRDKRAYDKFSFIYEYRDIFFSRFSPHAWGNDYTRIKDVVRNMTGSMANSEPMKKARTAQQETSSSITKPFEPNRWYTKPLMELNKTTPQILYLMRERGISEKTLMQFSPNILAISDMLKFKAPNGKRADEIAQLLDRVGELTKNKKENVMSFIRSMDNIDTHFNQSYFNQDIIKPLKKEGLDDEALQPIANIAASCTPFEMNRAADSLQKLSTKVDAFQTTLLDILQKAGIPNAGDKANNLAVSFNRCFFEKQLQSYLLIIENELPECYIEDTQAAVARQLDELSTHAPVSENDKAQAHNFIDNIHVLNLKDSASYQEAFRQAFKCLSPEGIFNFSPEYKPIAAIRKSIIDQLAALRHHPLLKTAAEIRNKVKNPMYKTINIAFPAKDLLTQQVRGYEIKCVNRSMKVNASGSDFTNYFVSLGQEDPQKVKNVYIFETSLDGLSFNDLQNIAGKPIDLSQSTFISCAGVPKSKHIDIILQLFPEAQIHICLDRDIPGKQATIQANCQLQGLKASFTVAEQHKEVINIPDNEKWDESKYPRKGRTFDPKTNQQTFTRNVNDKYNITVQGNINGEPFSKTLPFLSDEISVQTFHERFPEVKKIARYHIPTIAHRGQVGKLELGGHEEFIPTKDWNEMLVAPKEIEKLNREFTQARLTQRAQKNQEKGQSIFPTVQMPPSRKK